VQTLRTGSNYRCLSRIKNQRRQDFPAFPKQNDTQDRREIITT
jgi:hypothetical protein